MFNRNIKIILLILFSVMPLCSSAGYVDNFFDRDIDDPTINPSALYCEKLGYEFVVKDTKEGELGVCVFSENKEVSAWKFLQGREAEEYNVCSQNGYELKIVSGSQCITGGRECAICVLPNGDEVDAFELVVGKKEEKEAEYSKERQKFYLIPIKFDKESISIVEDITVLFDFMPLNSIDNEDRKYWIELVANDGSSLEKKQFSVNFDDIQKDKEEDAYLETLLYYDNAVLLRLYDANRVLLDKMDISQYSNFCGNKICNEKETLDTCPDDCVEKSIKNKSVLNKIQDNKEAEFDEEVNNPEKNNLLIIIVALIVFATILIGFGILMIFKKSKNSRLGNQQPENRESENQYDL